MPSTGIAWPSEIDLRVAEHPYYVHLCRVLAGLRRVSTSDSHPIVPGADMTRDTQKLVDVLETVRWRTGVLAIQLRDGTATTDHQREVADEVDELLDLLRSHAADVDAGFFPAPRTEAPRKARSCTHWYETF